jgi:hypothetical protein
MFKKIVAENTQMKNNLNESASDDKSIQKEESELSLYSLNLTGYQSNHTKLQDVIEYDVKNNNHDSLVTDEANYDTITAVEKQKSESNTTLAKRFEKSLLNFLEYSTIGGLSELGKRKELYLRIFWMIVVLMCSSYALVTIIETIKIYYRYEVILAFDKYQDMPIKFPAITICNENQFNERYAFNYLKNLSKTYLLDNGDPEDIVSSELQQFYFSIYDRNQTVNQLKITLINYLNETELTNIGYDLDSDLLISCLHNGNLCSEKNGDFKKFWNNIYGNCYTFNRGNNSYLTGDQNGLHLEMIVSK